LGPPSRKSSVKRESYTYKNPYISFLSLKEEKREEIELKKESYDLNRGASAVLKLVPAPHLFYLCPFAATVRFEISKTGLSKALLNHIAYTAILTTAPSQTSLWSTIILAIC
jgi:hypothetical protein